MAHENFSPTLLQAGHTSNHEPPSSYPPSERYQITFFLNSILQHLDLSGTHLLHFTICLAIRVPPSFLCHTIHASQSMLPRSRSHDLGINLLPTGSKGLSRQVMVIKLHQRGPTTNDDSTSKNWENFGDTKTHTHTSPLLLATTTYIPGPLNTIPMVKRATTIIRSKDHYV